MRLTELAQAIEDGKRLSVGDGIKNKIFEPPFRNDSIKSLLMAWCEPRHISIAPEKKPIDLSVLIESGIDCEFQDDGAGWWSTGTLLKLYPGGGFGKENGEDEPDHFECCRPRMNYWHDWRGGMCPLPEGLEVTVTLRSGWEGRLSEAGDAHWNHAENVTSLYASSDITAFKVIGLADGYCVSEKDVP